MQVYRLMRRASCISLQICILTFDYKFVMFESIIPHVVEPRLNDQPSKYIIFCSKKLLLKHTCYVDMEVEIYTTTK